MSFLSYSVVRVAVLALWGPGFVAPTAPPVQPGPPLLVVVERGPGAGCDAESVRAAIAAELGVQVVAPTAPSSPAVAAAGPRTNVLLVAIDRQRIVLTLRGPGDREITRAVPSPAEPAAQLKVIAWLAGNLARDQLATLKLPETPTAAAPDEPAAPPTDAAVAAPPEAPAAPAAPAIAPPAFAGAAPSPAPPQPPPASSARPEEAADVPRWTLTLLGGAAATFTNPYQRGWDTAVSRNVAGALEAHRHAGGWFAGAALDVGPYGVHPFGVALLAGAEGGLGRARLEASFGLGVEAFDDRTMRLNLEVQPPSPLRPAAYLRGALAVAYPLARGWDAVAELGAHLTASDASNTTFVLGALGLRLTLPSAAPAPSTAPRVVPVAVAFPIWTVTLSGGVGLSFASPWQQQQRLGPPGAPWGGVAALELHRHFGAWFAGVVADFGPRPYHQIAGALLLGKQALVRGVRLEGSGGLGVEQFNELYYFQTGPDTAQQQDITKARPYARVAFSTLAALAPQVDAVAQLVGHLTMTDQNNAGAVVATFGVRLNLP